MKINYSWTRFIFILKSRILRLTKLFQTFNLLLWTITVKINYLDTILYSSNPEDKLLLPRSFFNRQIVIFSFFFLFGFSFLYPAISERKRICCSFQHAARKSNNKNYFKKCMHKIQRYQNYLTSSNRYKKNSSRHFYEQRIWWLPGLNKKKE
jgi:hypothetical protein